ncbi:hypothetical protein [Shimia sagamensis]|uniref:Uncharacterized protein n=1 Tax=Shimia sagamensis TaxID=1566352 RepID=A0ABY1P870_9RHOB|nr:hypothetical protein [Shimia sagamensis]SMP28202.1 hypothetical protein SAMN06265373_1062 [Shimia sagamensis]
MQDRYAGDIGDFIKLGLLRALSPERKLGVVWYRFPDEIHNGDGRHIGYLDQADRYAVLDPPLFNHLKTVVATERSITSLLPVVDGAVSFDESTDQSHLHHGLRRQGRSDWMSRALLAATDCDLVFADPDNGIVDDDDRRKGRAKFGKHIPLSEVRALADGRCAVIYHHNTRRKGGHGAEVDHWLAEIQSPALAVRAKAYSPRTFFIINPDDEAKKRTEEFCERWRCLQVHLHR